MLRAEGLLILRVVIADPPLLNFSLGLLMDRDPTYYSAKAMTLPFPEMAELTFPFSVVTLERGISVPLTVVRKDATIELFGVVFPSSAQYRVPLWSCSHEGPGEQPVFLATV